MTNTAAIRIVAQAKPEDDWLHRSRNFGEDVFVRFRPEYDVSLQEIDAAFNGFDIRAVPQERSGAVMKVLMEVVREHHLEDSVFVTAEQVTTARTVGLVLDGSFGERLFPLAVRRDLWVVPSDANRPAVEQIRTWSWLNDYPERTSVTMWSSPIATATESDWLSLLETIERHHGEDSCDPPVRMLSVYGAPVTDATASALERFEYALTIPTALGFLALKRVLS